MRLRFAYRYNHLVLLHLINSNCMPSLLYGLEACPIVKSELSSLDFVINRFFMKMFRTNNIETVRNCQPYLGFYRAMLA